MAEAKPGDKRCDKCDKYDAVPTEVGHRPKGKPEDFVAVETKDLCSHCLDLVESAIARAVKPK